MDPVDFLSTWLLFRKALTSLRFAQVAGPTGGKTSGGGFQGGASMRAAQFRHPGKKDWSSKVTEF